MKDAVLDAIGETELRRSARVNAALAANDRVKYLLSLLQMAVGQAEHPEQPLASLKRERLACGLDAEALDDMVATARREGHRYRLPGAAQAIALLAADMRVMATPILAEPNGLDEFARRLERLLAALPQVKDDLIEGAEIVNMTQMTTDGDSLHRLVVDLHKALNVLQRDLAEDKLDGASVSRLEPPDRRLVSAFMAGVSRTAPLKFAHPGLGCLATRSNGRLVIQNDIGTTDAHVIVIHIDGLEATLTYTDVHPERVRFLRELLSRFAITWSGERREQHASLAAGSAFTLLTGRFVAKDVDELRAYLEFLGSRLVFLIDWNRARKQLRSFLPGRQREALLLWAAEAEIGHRGFLELGGARLINEAIEATAGSTLHFGDRLCDVLGRETTTSFLRFALRAASEGLRARQSHRLIRDRVRAELQAHFSNEGKRLLRVVGDHAGLVFEITTLLYAAVRSGADGDGADQLARRARAFEHDADQLVMSTRETVRRRRDQAPLLDLIEAADDAADELEEGAFLMELLTKSEPANEALDALTALADVLMKAAQEWVKTLAHAAHVDRPPSETDRAASDWQDDIDDFLTAIDRVCALEHEADDVERALTYAAVQHARDFRQLHLYSKVGECLEEAADALKRSSLLAREHVLGSVLGG